MLMNQIERGPLFHNFAEIDGTIWFWDVWYNKLFFCREDGNADIVMLSCYEEQSNYEGTLYGKVVCSGNRLLFIPFSAENILIYNTINQKEEYIPLSEIEWGETTAKAKFWDVLMEGRYIFLIGYYSSYILKFDMESEKVIRVMDLYADKKKDKNIVYFKKAVLYNRKLFIPSCIEQSVFIIDIDSMNYTIKQFDMAHKGFSSINNLENEMWLAPRWEGPAVCWDCDTNEVNYTENISKYFHFSGKPGFGFIKILGDSVYLFPLNADAVLMIDRNTLEVRILEKMSQELLRFPELNLQKVWNVEKQGEELCVYSGQEFCFLYISQKGRMIRKKYIRYSKKVLKDLQIIQARKLLSGNKIMQEDTFSLIDFLEYMETYKRNVEVVCVKKNIGAKIYQEIGKFVLGGKNGF